MTNSIAKAQFEGGTIVKVSATDAGDTGTTSETNIGLILGVSIPLGILLFTIIGIIVTKSKSLTPKMSTTGGPQADSEKDFKGPYDEEHEKIEQI